MSKSHDVEIKSIGAHGDGIGTTNEGERIFVPMALPGELWRSSSDTFALASDTAPERRAPRCDHFDICGGCTAQHMSNEIYQDWKLALVTDALARENIEATIQTLWSAPAGSRRRATFELRHKDARCQIGFHGRKDHQIFDMTMCSVLAPSLLAALPAFRDIGKHILPNQAEARVYITAADNGLAVTIEAKRLKKLPAEIQSKIARMTKGANVIQLMINGDIFVSREAPVLKLGPTTIKVSERTFLQAVPAAEQEMQRLVCDALAKCKSIADIFCGVGTFCLPLARKSRMTAFDNDVPAIDVLNNTVRHTQGLKPVTASRRDLFRQPLGAREFKGIDGVVINPPRAGAKAQCEQLAKSTVRTIVMVSCNPTTFARDARILLDAGYTIGPVYPIDQFLWSPHVEVVATFTRR